MLRVLSCSLTAILISRFFLNFRQLGGSRVGTDFSEFDTVDLNLPAELSQDVHAHLLEPSSSEPLSSTSNAHAEVEKQKGVRVYVEEVRPEEHNLLCIQRLDLLMGYSQVQRTV